MICYTLVPPFEVFRGAALSLVGSIASKCVTPNELGNVLVENYCKQ